jgi:hypothetical protein
MKKLCGTGFQAKCNDTRYNDVQHYDTQHNDTQHDDTEHNGAQPNFKNVHLSVTIMISC